MFWTLIWSCDMWKHLLRNVLEKQPSLFLCLQTSTHLFSKKHMFLLNQAWGEPMPWGPRTGRGWKHAGPRGAGEIHPSGFLEDVLKWGLPPAKRKLNLRGTHRGSFEQTIQSSKRFWLSRWTKMGRQTKDDQACYYKTPLNIWLSWSQILHHRNHDLQEVQSCRKSQWSKPMLRITVQISFAWIFANTWSFIDIHLLEYLVRYWYIIVHLLPPKLAWNLKFTIYKYCINWFIYTYT